MTDLENAAKTLERFSFKERSAYLRKFRRQQGLSLSDVASLARLNKSTLSRYERGSMDLKVETFARLQDVFVEVLREREILDRHVASVKRARLKHPDFDEVIGALPAKRNPKVVHFAHAIVSLVPPKSPKEFKTWIAEQVREGVERRRTGAVQEWLADRLEQMKARLKLHEEEIIPSLRREVEILEAQLAAEQQATGVKRKEVAEQSSDE
jgi:transcriptional regulator with XRE-family HTH domain